MSEYLRHRLCILVALVVVLLSLLLLPSVWLPAGVEAQVRGRTPFFDTSDSIDRAAGLSPFAPANRLVWVSATSGVTDFLSTAGGPWHSYLPLILSGISSDAESPDVRAMDAISVEIPVLAYHMVDTRGHQSKWNVPVDEFARQMDALQAYGYQGITLDDFLNYRQGIGTPPSKPVIVTFDDGYQDVFVHARPILLAKQMKATLFIITGVIADDAQHRKNNSWDNTKSPTNCLTTHMIWPEVQTMYNEGFLMGSHTVSHTYLPGVSPLEAQWQITASRQSLQQHLGGQAGRFFAYPNGGGATDATIKNYVHTAGYSAAVAYYPPITETLANPAVSDIWAIPRMSVISGMSVELNPDDPWWFFMTRVDPDFPIPDIQIDSFTASDSEGGVRQRYYPGEVVSVTVESSNWGDSTDVVTTLRATSTTSSAFQNVAFNPTTGVAKYPFYWAETGSFTFTYTIPMTAPLGDYNAGFRAQDRYKVLGYAYSRSHVFKVEEYPLTMAANHPQMQLLPSQQQDLVLSITNSGSAGPGEATYLSVSFSKDLTITGFLPAGNWKYYPPGSRVACKSCPGGVTTTTYALWELVIGAFGEGTKSYTMTVKALPTANGAQWIKYRLAMRVPGGIPIEDWYLRLPRSGEADQQGWASTRINVSVTPKLYLPQLFKYEN